MKSLKHSRDREYTWTKLQKLRTDFMQKQTTDVNWLEHLWDGGRNTIALASSEINQISFLAENPNVHCQLLELPI
jgi:hypothetical protein